MELNSFRNVVRQFGDIFAILFGHNNAMDSCSFRLQITWISINFVYAEQAQCQCWILTAITFSLMPPTGKTLPVNDTSPVIATLCRTGLSMASEVNAVTIVMPALGPSFFVAPSGTWIWICVFSKNLFVGSILFRKFRATVNAICDDSFITSPKCPVTWSELDCALLSLLSLFGPIKLRLADSMNKIEPPMAVQAKPMTTPGGVTS